MKVMPLRMHAIVTFACLVFASTAGNAQQMMSVQSGDWDDPNTWCCPRTPTAADKIMIMDGTSVTIDSDADCLDLMVMGDATLTNDATLKVRTFHVHMGGHFSIQHAGHVVIRDMPPQTPDQTDVGIMVMGSWDSVGIPVVSWSKAVQSVGQGQSSVTVNSAAGWQVGDEIVIGDTAAKPFINARWRDDQKLFAGSHIATITGISGNTVSFAPAMPYTAPSIATNPWGVQSTPPVGLLTRTVTVSSENPLGNRGHFMAMNGCQFSAVDTAFIGLGRTSPFVQVSPTNQIGRYALHFHRTNDPNTQIVVDNCVIRDFNKFGIVLHEASHAIVTNNVVCDGVGAGILTERGNEINNLIAGNLVCKISGGYMWSGNRAGVKTVPKAVRPLIDMDGRADIAADGSGIWCRSIGNTIVDNCIVDCAGYGMNFNGYYRDGVTPIYDHSGNIAELRIRNTPQEVARNEIAGCFGGFWFTYSQAFGAKHQKSNTRAFYDDHLLWNIRKEAVTAYHDGIITMRGFTIINELGDAQINRGHDKAFLKQSSLFRTQRNYEVFDMEMEDVRACGVNIGFETPSAEKGGFLSVRNGDIHCWIGCWIGQKSNLTTVDMQNVHFTLRADHACRNSVVSTPTHIFGTEWFPSTAPPTNNTGGSGTSTTDNTPGSGGGSGSSGSGSNSGGDSSSGSGGDSGSDSNNDSGSNDSGSNDSGSNDSGSNDSGSNDSGSNDSGSNDSGSNDSGSNDSGSNSGSDGGEQEVPPPFDIGSGDSGSNDSGSNDSGSNDSESNDNDRESNDSDRESNDNDRESNDNDRESNDGESTSNDNDRESNDEEVR